MNDVWPTTESLQLFGVPLTLAGDIVPTALNAELAAWVLAERASDAGIQRSNAGGWHSKPDLPIRGVSALDTLLTALVEQVHAVHQRVSAVPPGGDYRVRFTLQAWATAMEAGHFVHVHDHADAHWSAVYYVDAGQDGDEDVGGRIAWLNPIGPHRALPGANLAPTSFELTPRAGLLVVFPGWLRHLVQPYRGTRPRICIAANIEARLS